MNYTVLVNRDNKIKDNYLEKIELVKTKDVAGTDAYLEKTTYNAYLELKEYLKEININVGISEDSAYRSVDSQIKVYNEIKEKRGEEYASTHVAIPTYSEHHTALVLDLTIILTEEEKEKIEDKLPIYEEIHKHLYKFGFILRYPKDKENITKYSYEPWHIRYVGLIPAKIMYENNLTLEEYLKEFSCVLYINKPKGITSFDVVKKISKLFGIKKVGHTGTLDPLATGVMLVTIGKATKIVELLTAEDKEYIADLELGYQTDTRDIEGNIINRKEIDETKDIEEVLNSFKKTYLQEVPIYSAIKVNGKKLYEYARDNTQVELPKKEVTIKEIELLEKNDNKIKFRALVSKGTYIRSLINDIGICLNTYATMTDLIRTKQGLISIDDTNTLEEVEENRFKLHKIEDVLDYEVIVVDKELEKKLSNGVKIDNIWNIKNRVMFKTEENKLIGIFENDGDKLRVWKNFV